MSQSLTYHKARHKAVAQRREVLLGTNQFPNFNEKAGDKKPVEAKCCCGGSKEHTCEKDVATLVSDRAASEFEALRLETEALLDIMRSSGCQWVVVSGETGLGGIEPTRLGRNYCDGLGLANQLIAAQAREAFLVVAGRLLKLEE